MAEIAKSGTPSPSTIQFSAGEKIAGDLYSGDTIAAGDACYIASSGLVMRSSGAAANAAAKVRGFAAISAKSGDAITLVHGINFRYGSGLTPGTDLYLSGGVLGGLADAASTGGTAPVAFVIDSTRIRVKQSGY